MAFIVISENRATSVAPANGDVILIQPSVAVTSASDGIAGFSVTGLTAFISGILAGDDNGGEFGANALVTVGETGFVHGLSSGIWLNGSGSVLNNEGTIQSRGDGFSFIRAAVALNETDGAHISNSGEIVGLGLGIDYRNSSGTVLVNDGDIVARLDAITGTRGISITNSGSIVSSTESAVDLTSNSSGLKLLNNGTIQAPSIAIRASDVVDVVRNKGIIDGDVLLGGGDDRFLNWGEVLGNVDLGAGADIYRATGAGSVEGIISAGEGNDKAVGGGDDDHILGGAGNDLLLGRAGDDTLNGGIGNDTLIGGAGNDLLIGSNNADLFVFAGAFGNDTIVGFSENDSEKIDISSSASIVSFADLTANHLTQVGNDTVITDAAGNTITLANFRIADLSAGDFIF